MSYEQLMQHAHDIEQKAVQLTKGNSRLRANEVGRQYTEIPDLYRPFAEGIPDPQSFDPLIDSMNAALATLCRGQQDPIDKPTVLLTHNMNIDQWVSSTAADLEKWDGEAATQFRTNFVGPYPGIVDNNFIMAAILRSALEAEKAIWINVRNDIDQIAHKTLATLDALHECGPSQWSVVFSVVATVVGIASVPLSPGLATVGAIVAASYQALAAKVADDPKPVTKTFSGGTPDAVIAEMREAIGHLKQYIADAEQKIADSMMEKSDALQWRARNWFVLRRPALADTTTGNGDNGMGEPGY